MESKFFCRTISVGDFVLTVPEKCDLMLVNKNKMVAKVRNLKDGYDFVVCYKGHYRTVDTRLTNSMRVNQTRKKNKKKTR